MELRLSSFEQGQVVALAERLLSPLDYPTLDGWRREVNRALKRLISADKVSFYLPAEGESALFSEEVSAPCRRDFPYREPSMPGGRSVWEHQARLQVWNRRLMYGHLLGDYYRSAYYHEFIVPERAHDAIGTGFGWGEPPDATSVATLLCHHERPTGPRFQPRHLDMLRLLRPNLKSGVNAYRFLGQQRGELVRMLDALGQALSVWDSGGREVHRTPALARMLQRDPESATLLDAIRRTGLGLALRLQESGSASTHALPPAAGEVRTATARYGLHASLVPAGLLGPSRFALVQLERRSPELPPDGALRERFGLTRKECEVARLMAQGRSSAQIAEALHVSIHTARRHAEHVLLKLGVHSRAEVAPKIIGM